MDYCLDTGDGTASIWSGSPQLDLDGDGLLDDLFTDLDGDGLADRVALDLDDDGRPEADYTDDGSGTWTAGGGTVNRTLRWFGLDGIEHPAAPGDLNADGTADRLIDVDRDGLADRAMVRDGQSVTGYVDTDGDGRWDVTLTDVDGDGTADGAAPV
ncbi:MAG: pullulanase [Mycobacterium sp.]